MTLRQTKYIQDLIENTKIKIQLDIQKIIEKHFRDLINKLEKEKENE